MAAPLTVEWFTPPGVFEALDLDFDLDAASPLDGPVPWVPAKRFLTVKENGLLKQWSGRVWLNPPYGRAVDRWVFKMIEHHAGVMLTFVRTDTKWWQAAAEACDALCFIRGRVQFVPGIPQPPGRRTPTDRPGASNCLFAFGLDCAAAVNESDLGVTFMPPRVQKALGINARLSALMEGREAS